MNHHRPLYMGVGIACVICAVLALLTFRPMPAFAREAPLFDKFPPNLDEWPGK